MQSISELDSPYKLAQHVRYVDVMPTIHNKETLSDFMAGVISMSEKEHTQELMRKYSLTKSSKWSYEQEWRVVSWGGREPGKDYEDVPFFPQELKSVIWGSKMASEHRLSIAHIVQSKYPHAKIFEIRYSGKSFEMEIIPYKPVT